MKLKRKKETWHTTSFSSSFVTLLEIDNLQGLVRVGDRVCLGDKQWDSKVLYDQPESVLLNKVSERNTSMRLII